MLDEFALYNTKVEEMFSNYPTIAQEESKILNQSLRNPNYRNKRVSGQTYRSTHKKKMENLDFSATTTNMGDFRNNTQNVFNLD